MFVAGVLGSTSAALKGIEFAFQGLNTSTTPAVGSGQWDNNRSDSFGKYTVDFPWDLQSDSNDKRPQGVLQ